MSSSTALLSMLGWSFLPDLVTGIAQNVLYGITIRAGDARPQPNSSKFLRHRRIIKILVVSLYLLYTIYEADWETRRTSDYYQDLGLPHDVDSQGIKSRFRRLAALHHPDKVSSQGPSSDNYFVHLKLAQDVLIDPVKRFAYERFGPGISDWRHCSSIRDYIVRGLQTTTLPMYSIAAVSMYALGMMGYLELGTYWRWFTLAVLCVFELHTISRPYFPAVATKFINPLISTFFYHPPYLPFQLIILLRKIAFTSYIAFSQIGPLLQSPEARKMQANPEVALNQSLDRLDVLAKAADIEAARMLELELAPYVADKQVLGDLKTKVKAFIVQNHVHGDSEVKDAMGRAIPRRRTNAPFGAKGNR